MHENALDALAALRQRGEELCILPQNLYEFWVVATRPLSVNGLGMSPVQAEAEIAQIKRLFRFQSDTPAVYPERERMVLQYSVSGKSAHDARIVAAMTDTTSAICSPSMLTILNASRISGVDS